MYVQLYIVARSCSHCCHGKTKILSIFIGVGLAVVNNIKEFSVSVEMQQLVPSVL
jgi:hypothetical protein